jgi:hypothetical protein
VLYDRAGSPIGIQDWARMMHDLEQRDRRHVRDSRVTSASGVEYRVSTVFLGIDLGTRGGPPLIYETMIFGPGQWNEFRVRYCGDEEAGDGHEWVVAALEAEG